MCFGVAVKSSWARRPEPGPLAQLVVHALDDSRPLELIRVEVVAFVVQDHELVVGQHALAEPDPRPLERPWPRPAKYGRHFVWLCSRARAATRLVELVDVCQVQGSRRRRHNRVVARDDRELPVRFPLGRDQRVVAENRAIPEIVQQPLVHDDVRRDQGECLRVVVSLLVLEAGVEVRPHDGERHDLRLAGARRHLEDVPRPAVLRGFDLDSPLLVEVPCEIVQTPSADHFVQVDQRLDRLALAVVVKPFLAGRSQVIALEPVAQQPPRCLGGAFVAAATPGVDRRTD